MRRVARRQWHRRAVAGAACITAVALVCAAVAWAPAAELPVIRVTVKRFEYSPREIRLKRGVPVVLEISSLDVVHGFTVPQLGVRATVLPGIPARVQVQPDTAGTFTFRCDVFCGSGHEDLDGTIIVSD